MVWIEITILLGFNELQINTLLTVISLSLSWSEPLPSLIMIILTNVRETSGLLRFNSTAASLHEMHGLWAMHVSTSQLSGRPLHAISISLMLPLLAVVLLLETWKGNVAEDAICFLYDLPYVCWETLLGLCDIQWLDCWMLSKSNVPCRGRTGDLRLIRPTH